MRARLMIAVLSAITRFAPSAFADEIRDHSPGIFFGTNLGFGLARFNHPQVVPDWKPGVEWNLTVGWQIKPKWSFAVAFDTWQDSALGTPQHLHTFYPRVEYAFLGGDGPFLAGGATFGFTDGDVEKRWGPGGALAGGYRWSIVHWVSLGIEGGAVAHLYTAGGGAFVPYLTAQLRFHGSIKK